MQVYDLKSNLSLLSQVSFSFHCSSKAKYWKVYQLESNASHTWIQVLTLWFPERPPQNRKYHQHNTEKWHKIVLGFIFVQLMKLRGEHKGSLQASILWDDYFELTSVCWSEDEKCEKRLGTNQSQVEIQAKGNKRLLAAGHWSEETRPCCCCCCRWSSSFIQRFHTHKERKSLCIWFSHF